MTDPHEVIYLNRRKSPARISLESLEAGQNLRLYYGDISEKHIRQVTKELSLFNGLRYRVDRCDGYFRVEARYAWDA